MRSLIVLCLWMAWPASAQSVYKCTDGAGGHLYQSQACPDGAPLRSWDTVSGPVPTSAATPSTRPAAAPQRLSQTPAPRVATPSSPRAARQPDAHARCLAARASRESALHKLGTRRRYDDLRRLNERVSAACNHRGYS